ncbi:MAG: hypothetical protein L0322_09615, partial [Chloroflexi bacterium]|nr:hypothetical protein [Chloroflexota bacterium]
MSLLDDHIPPGGDVVGGDKVGGDKVGGDKAGRDFYKTVIVQPPPPAAPPIDPAAAEVLLAQMPEDEAPAPAALPPGSRMLFSANPHFAGRADALQQLARRLKRGQTAAIGQVAAVSGLGGVGKTQLAAEFVHRYGRYFAGGVFWLSFASPETIPTEVAGCGRAMGLPGLEHLALPDQVARVRQEWQQPTPRLLVFDNCEDERLLAAWRPLTGGCRVLLTSRRGRWDPGLGVANLALNVLARPESVALLQNLAGFENLPDLEAEAIAAELGDFPLALHLAGSFLAYYAGAITPADYLADLRGGALLDHPALQGAGSAYSPTGHERHVARTFALSTERLDPQDATDSLAMALLARAAC